MPWTLRRRLAGKFFACPECGASKRLPPFKLKFSPRQLAASGFAVLVVMVFLVVAVRTWMLRTPPAGALPLVNLILPPDDGLNTVRAFLKTYSKDGVDGKWEEVRWWPKRLVKIPPEYFRAARLQFRGTNALGELSRNDVVFSFDADGKIEWFIHPDERMPVFRNSDAHAQSYYRFTWAAKIAALMDAEPAR